MAKQNNGREIINLPNILVARSIIVLEKARKEYTYDVIDSSQIDQILNELERAKYSKDEAHLLESWAYLLSDATKTAKNYPDDYGLSFDELDELDSDLDDLRK